VTPMSPVLANESAGGVVAFLVVLLAMMLIAVIRLPKWDGSADADAGLQPAPTATAWPPDEQARAAATIARAAEVLPARPVAPPRPDRAATSLPARRPGPAGYTARHGAGPAPAGGTVPRPKVTGGPPWGPASRPRA
jgi:hypothetical protein